MMDQESIVYGCIQDLAFDPGDTHSRSRRRANREVLLALPDAEDWHLLCREMFCIPSEMSLAKGYQTEVMHFGASYKAVEYEWEQWISSFEAVLKKMYWVSAIVHLQTELSGSHVFSWESSRAFHEPDSVDMAVRCEWSQEGAIA